MDYRTRERVIKVVERWALNHPKPDCVILHTGVGEFSPNEIMEEVRGHTQVGQLFLRIIQHGMNRYSVDEVLNAFDKVA